MPYLAHFGLEEHPFTLTPDVGYFFPTQEHANIIASVEFALKRDTGIIKVVGEVGTGKTLLCRLLIQKLVDKEAVAYINAPRASAQSIILAICAEFGIAVDHDADAAYGALNRFLVEEHAKGRLAVVVVDEAQHLGREGLELVRLISNLETEKRKLLQIVLFGQTELDELLADPSLRQLNQRIAFSLATKPLSLAESKDYITHRAHVSRRKGVEYEVFSARAVDLLARSCGGIPRVINIIADKSLLAAFAAGAPVVQPAHVAEALKESATLVRPTAANPRRWWARAAIGAATYFGAAVALAVFTIGILAALPERSTGQGVRAFLHALSNTVASLSGPHATVTSAASTEAAKPDSVATAPATPAPSLPQAAAPTAAEPPPAPKSEPAAAPTPATEPPASAPPVQATAAPVAAPAPAADAKPEPKPEPAAAASTETPAPQAEVAAATPTNPTAPSAPPPAWHPDSTSTAAAIQAIHAAAAAARTHAAPKPARSVAADRLSR